MYPLGVPPEAVHRVFANTHAVFAQLLESEAPGDEARQHHHESGAAEPDDGGASGGFEAIERGQAGRGGDPEGLSAAAAAAATTAAEKEEEGPWAAAAGGGPRRLRKGARSARRPRCEHTRGAGGGPVGDGEAQTACAAAQARCARAERGLEEERRRASTAEAVLARTRDLYQFQNAASLELHGRSAAAAAGPRPEGPPPSFAATRAPPPAAATLTGRGGGRRRPPRPGRRPPRRR